MNILYNHDMIICQLSFHDCFLCPNMNKGVVLHVIMSLYRYLIRCPVSDSVLSTFCFKHSCLEYIERNTLKACMEEEDDSVEEL
jgi:hypothetical protein